MSDVEENLMKDKNTGVNQHIMYPLLYSCFLLPHLSIIYLHVHTK